MTFAFKPDFDTTQKRMEAFWTNELIDRPLVHFHLSKPASEQVPLPESHHTTAEQRWMDAQFQAEHALARLSNQIFMGDTLPIAFPNLGPEVFSGFYGCPLHFGDYGTSWTDPILHDWNQVDQIKLDWNSPYLTKLLAMTDALLEAAQDKFIVGMTDWHPGADCIAAFRDPQELAMDMITEPEKVKSLLAQVEADYFQVYDLFYEKLRAAGQPITSWLPLFSFGKYYIPSNDFSIMVSKPMYDEFFLPGITRECRFLDHSIYHLDGPGALRHLDSILSIPELNAIQWVPGAGNEGFCRWIEVYQKIQSAGKGIIAYCNIADLPHVMNHLNPHGLILSINDVEDPDTGKNILREMERWSRNCS